MKILTHIPVVAVVGDLLHRVTHWFVAATRATVQVNVKAIALKVLASVILAILTPFIVMGIILMMLVL